MANPTTVTYEDGNNLAAGWITTDQVPLVADTYYTGMLLEYDDTTNDSYQALASGTLAAIYNGPERTLSTAGVGSVISAGEINEEKLVDASGAAITLTEDQRAAYRDAGFYMKRS